MEKYKSPIGEMPDEHMRMVGVISTHWEWVEMLLERAVAEIMEFEDFNRVAPLTTNITFHPKCDIILAYSRHFQTENPPEWAKFNNAITQLRNAYSKRNLYVHGKWKLEDGPRITEVRTRGGKFTIRDEKVDIQEMNAAAQEIINAGDAFLGVVQPYGVLARA